MATHQQLLVENLDLIHRLIRFVGRRHHLSSADIEEFAGVVRLKLVEDDFAILRKFEGRSTLTTYLTVVIERLCHDFAVAKRGKWRASVAARRMGEVAMLLERLTVRDGVPFDEAVSTLQTNYGASESRLELAAMLEKLPARSRWNAALPHGEKAAAAEHFADPYVRHQEDEQQVERVSSALSEAIAALAADDQRLLRLKFEDNLSVPEIAEVVQTDSRALYRRLHTVIRALRASLEAQGIGEADMRRLVGHPTMLLRSVLGETPV